MKALLIYAVVFCGSTTAAKDFVNLDFESVRQPIELVDPPIFQVAPSSQAFPGWSVSLGDLPQTQVSYNSVTLGSGGVDLFSTFPPRGDYGSQFITSGHYSAGLQTGAGLAALSQVGTVPIDSRTLLFDIIGDGFQISLAGSLVPAFHLAQATTGLGVVYDTYGVDVTSLTGKDAELKFSSAPLDIGVMLDNIRFSPVALVPEPSTCAMFGLGLAALLWKARQSNRP